MPLTIQHQNITKMKVDAIVNAANTQLLSGGGVCGAIFKAAGYLELNEACQSQAPIGVGDAIITPGFALPAKFIIHTVGPIYQDGKHNEKIFLGAAYHNSLQLAIDNECDSIAFPLLSSGIYGYPKAEALKVAVETIKTFLLTHELDVYLVVFDAKSLAVSKALLGKVESFIDEYYVDEQLELRNMSMLNEFAQDKQQFNRSGSSMRLENLIDDLDESFSSMLLRLIDRQHKTDVEIYKKANLDRKLFSKIRSNDGYMPSKRTAIALAMALELPLIETEAFLKHAGYALSRSQKSDVIIEYFILHHIYDVHQINQILFKYDQPLLGA